MSQEKKLSIFKEQKRFRIFVAAQDVAGATNTNIEVVVSVKIKEGKVLDIDMDFGEKYYGISTGEFRIKPCP